MQYTLRNLPPQLDRVLRERAARENKSMDEVAIGAMLRGFALLGEPVGQRDLSDVAGTWQDDPLVTMGFDEQRRVDPELWR